MTQPRKFLGTAGAANYLAERGLAVNPETVRRWAVEGRLRHVRLPSGHKRYSPDDLDALLKAQEAVA